MNEKHEAEKGFTPVYLAYRTFEGSLDRLASGPHPPHIDRSYLTGMSHQNQTLLMGAYRNLELTGEHGEVRPALVELVQAKGDDRRRLMGDLLRKFYPSEVALSERHGTSGALRNMFDRYGLAPATKAKAMTFFVHALHASDIPLSQNFKPPQERTRRKVVVAKRLVRKPEEAAGDKTSTSPAEPSTGTGTGTGDPLADARQRYLDLLLKKAEEDTSTELLDRIESLLGFDSAKR